MVGFVQPGKDYYLPMFLVELASAIFILIAYEGYAPHTRGGDHCLEISRPCRHSGHILILSLYLLAAFDFLFSCVEWQAHR